MKAEVKDQQNKYFIHYAGWNKKYYFLDGKVNLLVYILIVVNVLRSWDEWVPESRVLKHNEQALLKQKELLRAHEAAS